MSLFGKHFVKNRFPVASHEFKTAIGMGFWVSVEALFGIKPAYAVAEWIDAAAIVILNAVKNPMVSLGSFGYRLRMTTSQVSASIYKPLSVPSLILEIEADFVKPTQKFNKGFSIGNHHWHLERQKPTTSPAALARAHPDIFRFIRNPDDPIRRSFHPVKEETYGERQTTKRQL